MKTRKKLSAPRQVRTGGRSARVVDDVLRAVLAEVDRVGYAAMRVDEVAARSGVNKTTIYRRWPTKAELIAAAVQRVKLPAAIADTGDVARDLTDTFVTALARADTPEGRGLMRMVQTEREHPDIHALFEHIRGTHAEARRARLRAAIKAGELPPDADVDLVQSLLGAAIFGTLVRHGERPSVDYVRRVVELVLAGVRCSPGKSAGRR